MSNYKVTKAALHNNLFIKGVKDLGKTIVAGEHVMSVQAPIELSLEGEFLKVKVGKATELVPFANVATCQ